MSVSNFIINDSISQFKNSEAPLKDLITFLGKNNIHYKDYPDENLILVFTKYNQNVNSELMKECRSMVLDRNTLNIVSYSCNVPLYNHEAIDFLLKQEEDNTKLITKCYEGTLIGVFNHNDKWYLSTRRCLDSKKSKWKSNKSHLDLFVETLLEIEIDLEKFYNILNPDYKYYFILIHHENINIVDYSKEFGENYKKIALAFVRNDNHQELDLYQPNKKLVSLKILMDENKIILPQKYNDLSLIDSENTKGYINIPPTTEGLIMKVYDKELNRNLILKFQTLDYQFIKTIGPTEDQNIYRGFLKLYQLNKLNYYIKNNKNFEKYKTIKNPLNESEFYDTIGSVDAIFKVLTSELYELFKLLYHNKNNKHKNTDLYSILPKEYREIIFNIRGLYFEKKSTYIKNLNNKKSIKVNFLKIKDLYNFLKSYEINKLNLILKHRSLLLSQDETNVIKDFKSISNRCDMIHLKLVKIYTNKLHPKI